jgi:hypothetical protein
VHVKQSGSAWRFDLVELSGARRRAYVSQVAVAATQGYELQWLQLSIFIYLNCFSGLVVLIHVHLLANTSNFVSGKVV